MAIGSFEVNLNNLFKARSAARRLCAVTNLYLADQLFRLKRTRTTAIARINNLD